MVLTHMSDQTCRIAAPIVMGFEDLTPEDDCLCWCLGARRLQN